ncbi:hypothetical protein EG328_009422 [Venturia inaequalis]|uniref:N-acetyltransferase domain-containing protein n=1 Tax=Venturia inaequalis TaxID=5025 RepID=A0A8H3UU32_VENIN|nr:hypothetical protein EG328_009422 [Venturia inaequalis]KAE9975688.1 hypothetical protein EG327_008385 [Venturia inaequalis]RDI83006.1 hypothetical protein Vi05172_g6884 [Venturia inaequalis]
MASQQAKAKAKWQPPHIRRVATPPTITMATEQVEKKAPTVTTKQVEVQAKKSSWAPPHLRKAQDYPVTPAPKSARSTLNANCPEYKPVTFMNNSPSSIRSVSPLPTKDASPAPAESASPVSAYSKASSSSTNTRETIMGLGLAGSKWAPVVPTIEQIATAEVTETRVKGKASSSFSSTNTRETILGLGLAGSKWAPVAPTAEQMAAVEVTETRVEVKASSSSTNTRKTVFGIGMAGSKWAPVAPTAEQMATADAPETRLKATADLLAVCMVMETQQELVDKRKKEALENGGEGLRYVSDYRKIREENEQQVAEIAKKLIAAQLGAAHSHTTSDQSQSIFWQRPSTSTDAPDKPTLTVKQSAQAQAHPVIEKSAEVQSPDKAAPTFKESAQVPGHPVLGQSVQVQSSPKCALNIGGVKESVSSKAPTAAKPATGLATNFSLWSSNSESQKTRNSSVSRPKTVALTAPSKSSPTSSISGRTGGSQKDDEQSHAAHSTGAHSNFDHSTTAQSTAPGLTAGATASDCSSHSRVEDTVMAATTNMLLPAFITPHKPQIAASALSESIVAPASPQHIPIICPQQVTAPAAPESVAAPKPKSQEITAAPAPKAAAMPAAPESVAALKPKSPEIAAAPKPKAAAPMKLATTLEGFKNFRPAAPASQDTNNMPRHNGWLTKAETKAMRSRPLSDWVIDEDAYDGEVQNNDWPANENSPNLCLRQWDGDWLPAPVDWSARNQYKRADKFAEDVAAWVNRTNNHYLVIQSGKSKVTVDLIDANGKTIIFENVPRSWVPEKVEGKSLQDFWTCLLQSSPEPLEAEDVHFAPFWQRYITQAHNSNDQKEAADFQESLPGPEPKLDVADCGITMYQKSKNQTAEGTSMQIVQNKLKDTARKEAVRQKHMRSAKKEAKRPVVAPPPNPHKPAENIYLRPATNRDDAQMAHIYNHYAKTHYSSAMNPITATEMEAKRRDITAANLNMIVAVLKIKQTGGKRANLHSTHERIVGFAYTDEHGGTHGLFRYAADLDVFVHPEYAHKGVGKSLVDRLMVLVDCYYTSRDAVEWCPMSDDAHLVCPGGKRRLGTVHINVFYPTDDEARLIWLKTWLHQFDFALRGKIEGGIKLGKDVTMACFVHKNRAKIDPRSARN